MSSDQSNNRRRSVPPRWAILGVVMLLVALLFLIDSWFYAYFALRASGDLVAEGQMILIPVGSLALSVGVGVGVSRLTADIWKGAVAGTTVLLVLGAASIWLALRSSFLF